MSIVVCAALVAACSDSSGDSYGTAAPDGSTDTTVVTSDAPVTTLTPAAPIEAPAPAAPLALTGTPDELAQNFELAVRATDGADPVAGWLGVYDALGIPVLDATGAGIGNTADDPGGPWFESVWMLSDTATQRGGIPLSDVVRLLGEPDDATADLAAALLADLRAALVDPDPQVALFGAFVRQRAFGTGSVHDLADPATMADDIHVDAATAQLITWVVIRGIVAIGAEQNPGSGLVSGLRSPAQPARRADNPCSEAWGDENTTFWVNWLANKIGSGTQLPGMEKATKGLLEKLSELNPHIISGDKVDRINSVGKKLNLAGGILGLLMSVSSLHVEVTQDPNPFERNKKTIQGDGKTAKMHWTISMEIGSLPDGNNKALCAAAFVLNTLGVGFSFPVDGKLPGVDVTFKGLEGFARGGGDVYVLQNADELKKTTDSKGEIVTTIIGNHQSHDYPDSAKEWRRVFSIEVSAQVEPENLNSLMNVFFGGLTFGVAPDKYGAAGSAIDILKTLHWSMGEQYGEIIDWQSGWKVDQDIAGYHITGIICDLEQPFTLEGVSALAGVGGDGIFTVTPTGAGAVTWNFGGAMAGAFTYDASGTGSIMAEEATAPVIRLNASDNWVAHTPAGNGPMGEHVPTLDLVAETLGSNECSQTG